MYLCVTGFLPDGSEDTSLKFELHVPAMYEEKIVSLLGHKSLNAMASGEWPLAQGQVDQIAALIEQPIPRDLDIFIGVEA